MSEARVVTASLSFAQGLFDMEFLLKGDGGSACADLTFDDGTTKEFCWFHDEITYNERDFLGKTWDEIGRMYYERDLAYLRS